VTVYFGYFFKGCPGAGEQTRELLITFIFSFHYFTAEPQRLPKTLGVFWKIAGVSPIQSAVKVSDKKGLGYILGDSFTNPSGHPGSEADVIEISVESLQLNQCLKTTR
jgi:hypothetical protein